ncbi:hypothetical protein IHC33_000920 [Enterococcus faecalis]|uniref:hypothetical protein n=1 Tax=Enterococcus faecalis TaxID=1351 RepID=UPI00100E615D|nr:hypothetical protein [Enterococcus faecalis]EGO2608941.1 hypothetical protein [Enterococcus faecalis]EGS8307240.1 hypothetical protein [Enterococcus faecalis]EHB5052839.1 hypothetical protein [Enterococcus faecalis]EKJ5024841.1 hypothetical protein [Enterococcus faecalis]EKZ0375873.1 hypothetical protein [Enterococcus faecalis]
MSIKPYDYFLVHCEQIIGREEDDFWMYVSMCEVKETDPLFVEGVAVIKQAKSDVHAKMTSLYNEGVFQSFARVDKYLYQRYLNRVSDLCRIFLKREGYSN